MEQKPFLSPLPPFHSELSWQTGLELSPGYSALQDNMAIAKLGSCQSAREVSSQEIRQIWRNWLFCASSVINLCETVGLNDLWQGYSVTVFVLFHVASLVTHCMRPDVIYELIFWCYHKMVTFTMMQKDHLKQPLSQLY